MGITDPAEELVLVGVLLDGLAVEALGLLDEREGFLLVLLGLGALLDDHVLDNYYRQWLGIGNIGTDQSQQVIG